MTRGDVILLDWDNTLHDAAGGFFAALQTVLARRGIDIDAAMYRAAYDPDYRTLYARLGLPAEDIPSASAEWRDLAAAHEPQLLTGAHEGLEALRHAGLALALVTASERDLVERQLATLGVAWLRVVVAGGEASAPRPDPGPINLALERLGGVPAAGATYAGDTPADVLMGRAAGVWSVGIAGFASDEEALAAAGADETAPSFAAWAERRLARGW